MPTLFFLCQLSDLKEGIPTRLYTPDGLPILLIQKGEKVFAYDERCAHAGGPLSEGEMDGNTLRCPWHNYLFDVETGDCINILSCQLAPYPIHIQGDKLFLKIET